MPENLYVVAHPHSRVKLTNTVSPWVGDSNADPVVIVVDNFSPENQLTIAHIEKALAAARQAKRSGRRIITFVAPGMTQAVKDGSGPVSRTARSELMELGAHGEVAPYNGTLGGLEEAASSRLPLRINRGEPSTSEEAERVAKQLAEEAAAAQRALEAFEEGPLSNDSAQPEDEFDIDLAMKQDARDKDAASARAQVVVVELRRREAQFGELALRHEPDAPTAADARQGELAAYANVITELATGDNESSPMVLALSGPWGSGKSTLAAGIRERIRTGVRSRTITTLEHNAWAHRDAARADAALLADLARQIKPRFWQASWRFVSMPQKVLGSLFFALILIAVGFLLMHQGAVIGTLVLVGLGGLAAAQPLLDLVSRFAANPEKAAERGLVLVTSRRWDKLLRRRLGKDAQLVIFVEDLDRCAATHALQVVSVAQQVLAKRGTTIILVADFDVVATGIGAAWSSEALVGLPNDARKLGLDFLQKVVQLHVELPQKAWPAVFRAFEDSPLSAPVPPSSPSDISQETPTTESPPNPPRKRLSEEETLAELVGYALAGGFVTPRVAKRVGNRLRLERRLSQELKNLLGADAPPAVSGYAVAKWVALAERFPAVWLTIVRNPGCLPPWEADKVKARKALRRFVAPGQLDEAVALICCEPLLGPVLPGLLRVCKKL